MSLLTLDQTTLFYYFLSDTTSKKKFEDFSSGINSWAAAIPKNSKPVKNKVTASVSGQSNNVSKHSGSIPPLTDATTRSSGTSALSKNIRISHDVPIKDDAHNTFIHVGEGGLEDDEDDTLEREAAIKSPVKGKKRVSSSVSK